VYVHFLLLRLAAGVDDMGRCVTMELPMTASRPILALLAAASMSAASAAERCSALSGDTLLCGRERVRVEGLQAPNRNAPGSEEARQRLQRRIRSGEVVIERKGRDKYGRTLGRVYVNGNRITQLDVTATSGRKARKL
jgi:endonuclease YncB( thermonuclease family)